MYINAKLIHFYVIFSKLVRKILQGDFSFRFIRQITVFDLKKNI